MFEITLDQSNKIASRYSLYVKAGALSQPAYALISNMECAYYDKNTKTIELPTTKIEILISTLSQYDDVTLTNNITKPESKDIKIPEKYKFKVKPYDHQIKAIEYGLNHDGWLLLDDMGLGKTKTIIDLVVMLKKMKEVKHCLVVCGIASLRYNWASEIAKNSDESFRILGRRVSGKGRETYATIADRLDELKNGGDELFVVTNVETLQNADFAKAYTKSKYKFDMIVFDEIHTCKTPTSKSAKTLMKLKAKRKIGLTGTIVTSHPEDCYVPLKWTGNTTSTYGQFKSLYNIYGGYNNVEIMGHKNLEMLKELLGICALRRTKEQMLDLPPKNYLLEYVEMSKEQSDLYGKVQESVLDELDKLDHKPTIIEEITINMRLRQITSCPSMLSTSVSKSAKLDRCEEMVENIVSQGDKVVVFSNFKDTVYEMEKRLSKYSPLIGTGDMQDALFSYNVNQFQTADTNKVFIGTWQKCGTGITLTSASYMIFIDTPWTDSDFQQACDRIYRIGQKKPVIIYTLITKDTYDERVQEIIEMKGDLANAIIDDKRKEN